LSQVQSDLINIDDSVSQVASREREQVIEINHLKPLTIQTQNAPFLPKTLLEIGSQVRVFPG